MTNKTNTILLTESGDLEVYDGKRPVWQSINTRDWDTADLAEKRHNKSVNKWLSTKRIVKMAEGECDKLRKYVFVSKRWDDKRSFPIDVSDIVEIKTLTFMHEQVALGFFKPPVDKEGEVIWESELRQLFKNRSDCYADTGTFENDGSYREGDVIQAMTEDRFIEVLNALTIKRK